MDEEKSIYFLGPGNYDDDYDYDYGTNNKANHLYKINPSMNNNHSIIDLFPVCVLPSYIPADENSFVSLDNKLYVLGGYTYTGCDTILQRDVYCMDTRSGFNGVWKRCSPMILGRSSPLTIAGDGLIYVFGGTGMYVNPWAEVFDPIADTWSQLPQPPEEYSLQLDLKLHQCYGPSCIDYCNGKVFMGCKETVWSFDIKNQTWNRWSLPFQFGFNSFAVVDEVMYFSCTDGLYGYDLVNTSRFTGPVCGLKMLYKERGYGRDREPRGYVFNLGNGKLCLIEDWINCVKFGVTMNYDQNERVFILADVEASAMYNNPGGNRHTSRLVLM